MFQFEGAIDDSDFLGIAKNGFGNHVVAMEPGGHLAPGPKWGTFRNITNRGREAARAPFPVDVLVNQLPGPADPSGYLGLGNQVGGIDPQNFNLRPEFPHIGNSMEDGFDERRGFPAKGNKAPARLEANGSVVAPCLKKRVSDRVVQNRNPGQDYREFMIAVRGQ